MKEFLTRVKHVCLHGAHFPAHLEISEMYKDLVNGCLKYDEKYRFDWETIFGHKIFDGKLGNI